VKQLLCLLAALPLRQAAAQTTHERFFSGLGNPGSVSGVPDADVPPAPMPIPVNPTLDQEIGQMIMLGFHGVSPDEDWPAKLREQVRTGQVGAVIFFKYNVQNKDQFLALTSSFKSVQAFPPLLLAIDQEGGKVQRLKAENGFEDFPSAYDMANSPGSSPKNAKRQYKDMARMLSEAGINFVLGPVGM